MIEAASRAYPELEFRIIDASIGLGTFDEDMLDVVFSNACIQWLPNHPKLLMDMMNLLKPGGVMAVQIPANYDEPIHSIVHSISESEEWRDRLYGTRSVLHDNKIRTVFLK